METKEIYVGKELSDWIKEKTINQFLELKSEYKNLSDAGKGAYIVTEDFCKKKGLDLMDDGQYNLLVEMIKDFGWEYYRLSPEGQDKYDNLCDRLQIPLVS